MASKAEKAIELFSQFVGQEDGVGDWLTIDQQRINAFADATVDHQFIHVDPEKSAKLSPYKKTIAHGFLTLSLLTHLTGSIKQKDERVYEGVVMGVNYGLDKVRFPAPVKVDSRIRARRELMSAELKGPNTIQLTHKVTIEVEGESKPSCVAEWVSRLMYG
jgi:acyl dehydratase